MQILYCGDCGAYLMGGDGECHDCHCGWQQPKEGEASELDLDNSTEDHDVVIIKGKDLKLGMLVQRMFNGETANNPMIIYKDGPYFKNPLYCEDEFLVINEVANSHDFGGG